MTADERIASRLAQLTTQRAAIPDDGALPLSTTRDEAAVLAQQRVMLDRRVAALQAAAAALAALPTIGPDEKWRAHLTTWRATCSAELLNIKSPIRDRDTKAHADTLDFSLKLIDHGLVASVLPLVQLTNRLGELMRAAGYETAGPGFRGPNGWRGSLPETEKRIADLTRQRAAAQAALDVLLRTDEEKAQQEAVDVAFRKTLNTMRIKHSSDGRSLVAITEDGDLLDPADMTTEERAAFERFAAAHVGPRETGGTLLSGVQGDGAVGSLAVQRDVAAATSAPSCPTCPVASSPTTTDGPASTSMG